ncbi:hypothetical protein [Roseobacter sp. HKCCA0434]|uniref:hypothetical protein n=1 Tax=Roseobacter sp. HKCCA0434 TaxID=3079297 RepID=UPI002905AFD7|nr:hypothetical protein [Roseobacter sp. HKCCA0434]
MGLELLAVLVAGGITGIVLLVHFTGGSAALVFTDDDDVRAAWAADMPDIPLADITRNAAGTAALVRTRDGRTGLIWSFGADAVSRLMPPDTLRAIDTCEDGLRLHFLAFETPSAFVGLTRDELPDWYAVLERSLRRPALKEVLT